MPLFNYYSKRYQTFTIRAMNPAFTVFTLTEWSHGANVARDRYSGSSPCYYCHGHKARIMVFAAFCSILSSFSFHSSRSLLRQLTFSGYLSLAFTKGALTLLLLPLPRFPTLPCFASLLRHFTIRAFTMPVPFSYDLHHLQNITLLRFVAIGAITMVSPPFVFITAV